MTKTQNPWLWYWLAIGCFTTANGWVMKSLVGPLLIFGVACLLSAMVRGGQFYE